MKYVVTVAALLLSLSSYSQRPVPGRQPSPEQLEHYLDIAKKGSAAPRPILPGKPKPPVKKEIRGKGTIRKI